MISIRKYLDYYQRAQAVAEGPEREGRDEASGAGFQASLAHLAAVLVSEIGAGGLGETDAAFEPYFAAIDGIRQRLVCAESPDEIQTLSAEIPQVLERFRRAKQEAVERQTEEMRKIVSMLQQAIEALSRGNERVVGRLRKIESQIRSASQLSEIVALRDRLRSCVEQIQEEAAAEQREFEQTRSELERDFLVAQDCAALARGGVPGRLQAEQRIAEAPGAGPLALVLLERLPAIKARYGTGVSERYFSGFVGELMGRLPSPKKVFRWNERTLLVELPPDAPAETGESELRGRLAEMPRAVQVDVGGRVAALENTHRWCLTPSGLQRDEILQRIEDFLRK